MATKKEIENNKKRIEVIKEIFKQYLIEHEDIPPNAYIQNKVGGHPVTIAGYLRNIKMDEDIVALLTKYKLIEPLDNIEDGLDMSAIKKLETKSTVEKYCKNNRALKMPYFKALHLGVVGK